MNSADARAGSGPVFDSCARATESAPLLIPDWPAPPQIRAVVTTRGIHGQSRPPFDAFNLGTRCGDTAAAVAANRAALITQLGLPSAPYWLHQVHGTQVVDVDATVTSSGDEETADAACARTAQAVLCVLSADCLPVLFCADDGSAIAAAHAGWRGLAAGVIEATIARLGVSASHVLAWLGPAIAARSYEVSADVRTAFVERDSTAASAFASTRPGHWRCDLYALARQRLVRTGVVRVYGGGFDTFTDRRFYSHRRDRTTGRFATLIWRADNLPKR